MEKLFTRLLVFSTVMCGWITLGSWGEGPVPKCDTDSLAIVRVVKPMNQIFDIKPVVYVSKGLGKIEQVRVTDRKFSDGELAVKETLTELLMSGYTIQTATESFDDGLKLSTYYLKKKAI